MLKKKLVQSEQRYKDFFEQSPIGLALCDLNGQLLNVNFAYLDIIGYELEEALELSYWDITPVKYASQEEEQLQLLKMTGKYGPYEKEYRHKNGSLVPVRLHGMIVHWEGKEYIWSSVEDITKLVKAEREIYHFQKMEALGTLAGGIAHDFNNILSAIIGCTQLIQDDKNIKPITHKYLDMISSTVHRAEKLVNQILMFSKKHNDIKKPVNLSQLVEEVFNLLRETIPSTIEMQLSIAPEIGFIYADDNKIHQVIMNLVTNAFQSIQDNYGEILISLNTVDLEEAPTEMNFNFVKGKYIKLSISDTGKGIDEEVKSKIFDPFFTTKDVGTGMGLAVVHGIISNHNGFVNIRSEVDKGSTFEVFLPKIDTATNNDLTIPNDNNILGGTEHILFVDDEPILVETMKKILEKLGYKVTCFTSANKALEAFKTTPSDFDILVSDITMPVMTGISLSKEIMSIVPDFPIILCTGYSNLIDKELAEEIGIKELLKKPISTNQISAALKNALSSKKQ